MILDIQSQFNHFNDLQQSIEARKLSPRKKSIRSLLKSYDKFSDYIDKNPGPIKKVTFLSSPERGSVGKFTPKKRVTVSMGADRGMSDSAPSGNENNASYFNEEPSLIIAIVRMVNGTATRCLKVKLMVNMQQFQDLRTDPKRLMIFKKKLQPLMLNLLPAEDRFKPWTIDSIEPCDIEKSSDSPRPKNVTNCGTTKEKPSNRFKRCTRNENYFEPFDSEDAMDFSAASSPCQLNTFCNSEKILGHEQNISEDGNSNCQQAEDLNRQYNLEHSPIDSAFKVIKDENITTSVANSDFIESEISENMNVYSDQDLFALLYDVDGQSVIKNENFNVKEEYSETEQISHPSGLPNHFSDTEIGEMEVATEPSNATTQNDGSKFDLSELLEKWDEESRFINRTKSFEKLNEASELNMPGNCDALEHNSSPCTGTTNAEIAPSSSVKNCHSPIFKCPSSNLQSNSCLTPQKSPQLGPCAVDNSHWTCNDTFNDESHGKHQLDLSFTETICKRSKNNVTPPNNNECLKKFNNYRSESLVKSSSLLSENSDENIIKLFDENEQINSAVAENNASVHQTTDFWNTDFGCSALSASSVQKIIAPSKFNNFNTFPSKSFRRLHSPILSSQQHTNSHSEQLGSLFNHTPESVVHSFSSPNIQSFSVLNGPADRRKNVIQNPFPKLEPLFQSCNSSLLQSTVQNSSLKFEHIHQPCGTIGESSQQMKPTSQIELIKNEINLRSPSFPSENNEPVISSKNVSLVKEAKNVEFGSSFSSVKEKNILSQDSNVHSLLNTTLNQNPLSFNRKPNCSILISSRLKSLSKNKSTALIATGRPVPKRKEIPFLMKGKLKRI